MLRRLEAHHLEQRLHAGTGVGVGVHLATFAEQAPVGHLLLRRLVADLLGDPRQRLGERNAARVLGEVEKVAGTMAAPSAACRRRLGGGRWWIRTTDILLVR